MMRTINGNIGCVKFPKAGIQEAKTAAGVSFIANTAVLVGLKVVIGNADIPAGATVYVSGKDYTAPWAKNFFKIDVPVEKNPLGVPDSTIEHELIFVPLSSVMVVG